MEYGRNWGFERQTLILIETEALRIRSHLPAFWLIAGNSRGSMPLFDWALFTLCICLALAQIISNRALLGRAHVGGTPDQNGEVLSPH